jgi:hypothetical protein
MRDIGVAILVLLLAAAAAPAEGAKGGLEAECENGLRVATHELDLAKAKGLGGTWEITKAATLLTGAQIQSGFGKYPNCIDKVRRARAFIARSRKGK